MRSYSSNLAKSPAFSLLVSFHEHVSGLIFACLFILWNFSFLYSSELVDGNAFRFFIVCFLLMAFCFYVGHSLKQYRARYGLEGQRLRAFLHICCVGVSAFCSFIGFNALALKFAYDSIVPYCLALMLFFFINELSQNLKSCQKWYAHILNVILLTVCLSISGLSNTIAVFPFLSYSKVVANQSQSQAREYVQKLDQINLTARLLSQSLKELSEYSSLKAEEESQIGFTCQADIGKSIGGPSPRRDLRNKDAKVLGRYSGEFSDVTNSLDIARNDLLDGIYKTQTVSEKQRILSQISKRYNTLLLEVKAKGHSLKQFFLQRINKANKGWEFKTASNRVATAFCLDSEFERQVNLLNKMIDNFSAVEHVQIMRLLDLESSNNSQALALEHLLDAIVSREIINNSEIYQPSFMVGFGLDAFTLIMFITIRRQRLNNLGLMSSLDIENDEVLVSTVTQKQELLTLRVLSESHNDIDYIGVDGKNNAIFKVRKWSKILSVI